MIEHAAVIVGGGPTGLMLAGELAIAGVDVAIVERRTDQRVTGARAGGLHARTIEVLDQRGIAERFLSEGQVGHSVGFAWIPLDISDFPTRHNYVLALWQEHIERILAGWVSELGIPIYRGREAQGFTQDDHGVEVELTDGDVARAKYLLGCDGGRSVIRKTAGIAFSGSDPTISHLIAEAELADEPTWGLRHDSLGIHSFSRMGDAGPARIMVTEQQLNRTGEPTLRDLSEALISVFGTDYGVHSPIWISRFTDMARQAASYRYGRVLLAGDSAHVHYPTGGQGLNTGVQDAVNLAWKLAQVIKGISPESLLDTYQTERHPVAARVLRNTMAQAELLRRTDDHRKALFSTVSELLGMDEPRKRFAGMISGLDIRYDLGEGHPLLGRRMPDLDLSTAEGLVRTFSLLHDAEPVLITFSAPDELGTPPKADRVKAINASYTGAWELPVIGNVSAPSAVLIRPDGYVAWVGDQTYAGLAEALATWFGLPTAAFTPV